MKYNSVQLKSFISHLLYSIAIDFTCSTQRQGSIETVSSEIEVLNLDCKYHLGLWHDFNW